MNYSNNQFRKYKDHKLYYEHYKQDMKTQRKKKKEKKKLSHTKMRSECFDLQYSVHHCTDFERKTTVVKILKQQNIVTKRNRVNIK